MTSKLYDPLTVGAAGGTTETNSLAQDHLPFLPPHCRRARVGLALMAATFGLAYLKASEDFTTAEHAFRLSRQWDDDETIEPVSYTHLTLPTNREV